MKKLSTKSPELRKSQELSACFKKELPTTVILKLAFFLFRCPYNLIQRYITRLFANPIEIKKAQFQISKKTLFNINVNEDYIT